MRITFWLTALDVGLDLATAQTDEENASMKYWSLIGILKAVRLLPEN